MTAPYSPAPKGATMGLVSDAITTAVLTSLAYQAAARQPPRSPARHAAAAACEALVHSATTDTARRRLEGIRDPALRADALALLAELEQLGAAAPAEETSS